MDETTFKNVCLPYSVNFYRHAYRMLENSQDAEDVVQEVFEKLWRLKNKLENIKNVEAYGITLTRNICIDRLKSSRYKYDLDETKTDQNLTYEMDDVNSDIYIIKSFVSELPDKQKLVFNLHYFKEFSIEEIEDFTKINIGNIRVLLTRAKKRIKEQFNNYQNRK
ncbi:MAG: RNA polymerase sigma factor [Bacteroidales bacterium]